MVSPISLGNPAIFPYTFRGKIHINTQTSADAWYLFPWQELWNWIPVESFDGYTRDYELYKPLSCIIEFYNSTNHQMQSPNQAIGGVDMGAQMQFFADYWGIIPPNTLPTHSWTKLNTFVSSLRTHGFTGSVKSKGTPFHFDSIDSTTSMDLGNSFINELTKIEGQITTSLIGSGKMKIYEIRNSVPYMPTDSLKAKTNFPNNHWLYKPFFPYCGEF